MKQLGNLAIICANRQDVLLHGKVTLHVGHGPAKSTLQTDWDDDQQISDIVHELNFGKFREICEKELSQRR